MTSKQERLKEVYAHLRAHHGIHTQLELAEVIHVTRPALSSAMNGNEAYLTKNLFQKICAAFPGVFNLNYLLTGDGDLLTLEEEAHNEKLYNPQPIDQSSLVNALLAAKDETIASLRRELDAKNETITLQRSRIAELERQLAAATTGDISRYPFTIGAAEDMKPQQL